MGIIADWTRSLDVAQVHADPSGVQETSTTFQALLFPGMSTQTARLRYISLLAAARHYRMQLGSEANVQLSLSEYLRRFEALIAASSVLHHFHDGNEPDGIVGRTAGRKMSRKETFELKTGLHNPPYNIYRGTLYNLGIFDTSSMSDPLFESAQPLGEAWDIDAAGTLGEDIKKGFLPAETTRQTVAASAPAFCLCRIPQGSKEQRELIRILFALQKSSRPSLTFEDEETLARHSSAYRSVAWRFLLELLLASEDEPLRTHHTLVYLLTHDFISSAEHPALHLSLQTWRWIAARTFFERGWTLVFTRTIHILKQEKDGLSRQQLQQRLQEDYLAEHHNESIDDLVQEAKAHLRSSTWLLERFEGDQRRDYLLCICIGLIAASRANTAYTAPILGKLWERGSISFVREYSRLERFLQSHAPASAVWAAIAEESLVQHFQIALRKMSYGNPDTLLVDFDAGQWRIPEKAEDVVLRPATGFTRLDIGLSWAQQLGLVKTSDQEHFSLTETGLDCCIEWDSEQRS